MDIFEMAFKQLSVAEKRENVVEHWLKKVEKIRRYMDKYPKRVDTILNGKDFKNRQQKHYYKKVKKETEEMVMI